MSNVGFQAVYKYWNQWPDVVCERFFLPDPDDKEELRKSRTPLLTLESQTPVRDFDVVAFSVTFEPDELHLISLLDMAGVPALTKERTDRDPLVIVGGPVTFLNPEPLASFVDVIAVGEAEAILPSLSEALRSKPSRETLLRGLEKEDGFYIPVHYEVRYQEDGRVKKRVNRLSGGDRVVRAKMGKRRDWPPPATYVITASTEMSAKFMVEVSRGCPTLCRFCWAGYNYLPKRSFGMERILDAARGARDHTSDIGLVSTAVGAHPEIVPLLTELRNMGFRVSVSSLRFEDLQPELLEPLVESGEKTLAVAPEVGSDRLRFAIHKRITNREILEKTELIFSRGVENLKLYLMVGLPGERDEDVSAIVELVKSVRDKMLEEARPLGRVGKVIASVNPFVPKPGTPFQWHRMASQAELNRKIRFLKKALRAIPNVEPRCKSPRQERLQALLALGDRRLAPAMLRLARGEADLTKALEPEGLELDFFIHRARSVDETLPWGHIDNGMKKELLVSQYKKAKTGN
jgi:radical SAM superfamily enzyme YgiQ (UPF0313 family)